MPSFPRQRRHPAFFRRHRPITIQQWLKRWEQRLIAVSQEKKLMKEMLFKEMGGVGVYVMLICGLLAYWRCMGLDEARD